MELPSSLGIMQPYFLPYVGYFQLIATVDEFVVYDNIKYTKKGWINRNRLLLNGKDTLFTLPLCSASDDLLVIERSLAGTFNSNKLLNQFRGAYGKAPQFDTVYPLLERILRFPDPNLFSFVHNSIAQICEYIGISTPVVVSSTININHDLKAQEKVLALCKARAANTYINSIGGYELYDREVFSKQGIELMFIKTTAFEYKQFNNTFVPWLSIIDVLMFNSLDSVRSIIFNSFELV